jgi:hypothetical protein
MKTITYVELQQALKEDRVAGLYDNRGLGSFNALHIKGAQQLAVTDVKDRLPADINAMLVFY